jgi:hypothetical protein
MEFRDPARESAVQEARRQQLEKKKNATDELRKSSLNIINNEGPRRKYDEQLKQRLDDYASNKHQIRKHHMLTNLPHTVHAKAPVHYNEEASLKELAASYKDSRLNMHHEHLRSLGHPRDFNIISNDYYVNPEQRKMEEYSKLKSHVLKKFWDTHDYDPIKGQYYSDGKEELYREQKSILSEVYGKSKQLSIPPSIQFAESSSYNIINQELYDYDKLLVTSTSANRALNRMNKLDKEAAIIEDQTKLKEKADALHLNRVKFNRWEQEMDRGYNFVKNEVVTNPLKPLPPRPQTMWDRLSTTDNNTRSSRNNPQSRIVDQFPENPSGFGGGGGGNNNQNESFNSTRIRNLSGKTSENGENFNNTTTGNHKNNYNKNEIQENREYQSHRAKTSMLSSRPSARENDKPLSSNSVPKLDLTKTDFGEPVSYQEVNKGPSGLSIPIVRTGGLSQYSK